MKKSEEQITKDENKCLTAVNTVVKQEIDAETTTLNKCIAGKK